ncbi:MAG TPA: M1 family metallopeptidase, partial [Candidatus Paceibacterota bacterium]|nr:M1 family metallopeptidase [Candidatus Paceibacterota bacterium]
MKNQGKVRLTTDVVPTKYDIRLKPDLEAFVFEGEETIHLTLKKPTKTLTLHSIELQIESARIIGGEVAEKISYDEKAETATIHFKTAIASGKQQLQLVFRGILNDKMHGFYRSGFMHEGKEHRIATTQFESTDARRAFPCFDEPAMKAVFDVSLTVPSDKEAISNTLPTDILEHESGYKTVRFASTPLMSTYLLAFIVGDFEHIEKKSKDGVLVRVFTTPGKKHQAQFALDCAVKTIAFFNEYFAIPYPMPALDMIAIPDFAAGAMENWGAITYRESALLVDSQQSSSVNKQWVALVIAHEIAHQWFGNLVTMEWWTHLWLNEGFASYIEYLAVDHVFPSWDIWTQFL